MRTTQLCTIALCTICLSTASGSESLIRPGATLQTLSTDFQFTEGPAADAEGNVFFTDQPNDRIMKWSVDGKLSTFLQPSGRSNGLYFARDGKLLACADERNELWAIDPDGSHQVLVDRYNGKLLNGPNDLWVHPQGSLYFTDPYYKRPYWQRGPDEQGGQCVYYRSADGKTLLRVEDRLKQPNGIVGTPDGKLLYVADIGDGKTYAYEIQPSGQLANRRLFCEMGSDGMTIDQKGNVYLTGQGVTIFSPTGVKLQTIAVPQRWTANVCFGGRDRRTLFITASRGLFSIDMQVAGVR
jgi:gluconolactonase